MGWAKDFAAGLSGGLAQPIKELVSEFITDKDKANELAHQVTITVMEHADREAERASKSELAQLEINKVEASHSSIFVSGARPAAIWVGVMGLFQAIVFFPLVSYLYSVYRAIITGADKIPVPTTETEIIWMILGPLLGLGGYRMVERLKGVQRNSLKE